MRGSEDKVAPCSYLEWLGSENVDWAPSYSTLQNPQKHELALTLHAAQGGLCVYCGCEISGDLSDQSSHIEHFRPQSKYPELSLEVSNLFLSCGPEVSVGHRGETCGSSKEDWFEEDCHVVPSFPNCAMQFVFNLRGEILPSDNSAEARKMIEVLNLDHAELRRERKTLILEVEKELLSGVERVELLESWRAERMENAIAFFHVVVRYLEERG